MAAIDFKNAVIEIPSSNTACPVTYRCTNLRDYNDKVYDSNGTAISGNITKSYIENISKKLVVRFSGTFKASGTEFYIYNSGKQAAKFKVSNISFQSGDTFDFDVTVNLTCL